MAKRDNFTSFSELATYFKSAKTNIDQVKRKALAAGGTVMRDKVRGMHGKKQEGRPDKGSSTPLLRTGKMRDSVNVKFAPSKAVVYTDMEWLAVIHEFGVTYKMTEKQRKYLFANVFSKGGQNYVKSKNPGFITIPARPIWRTALDKHRGAVLDAMEKELEDLFE